jgi:hypothetical protein
VQRTWTVNPCQKKYKGKHTKKLSTTNNVKFHFLPIDKELKKKKTIMPSVVRDTGKVAPCSVVGPKKVSFY